MRDHTKRLKFKLYSMLMAVLVTIKPFTADELLAGINAWIAKLSKAMFDMLFHRYGGPFQQHKPRLPEQRKLGFNPS